MNENMGERRGEESGFWTLNGQEWGRALVPFVPRTRSCALWTRWALGSQAPPGWGEWGWCPLLCPGLLPDALLPQLRGLLPQEASLPADPGLSRKLQPCWDTSPPSPSPRALSPKCETLLKATVGGPSGVSWVGGAWAPGLGAKGSPTAPNFRTFLARGNPLGGFPE